MVIEEVIEEVVEEVEVVIEEVVVEEVVIEEGTHIHTMRKGELDVKEPKHN